MVKMLPMTARRFIPCVADLFFFHVAYAPSTRSSFIRVAAIAATRREPRAPASKIQEHPFARSLQAKSCILYANIPKCSRTLIANASQDYFVPDRPAFLSVNL